MRILGIETSTEYCSVAVWQDGVITERSELVGQKHSEMLIAMVDDVLKEAGMTLREMDGIAFGKGPGSFTGVRIACGVAQGLALGADLQVVGVCTLEALAQASARNKVIAALDARMGELYFATYEKQNDVWNAVVEPSLCKAEDAPVMSGEGWFGMGSGFALYPEALTAGYGDRCVDFDAQAVPQASAVAQLAAKDFAQGEAVDAAMALPLYLRDKVALTTSERGKK